MIHGVEGGVYTVDVGFTMVRPIVPDQYVSRVTLTADTDCEAHLIAALMVAGRPGVRMPTSTLIVAVLI